jgi:large subunit ribosomal protein L29
MKINELRTKTESEIKKIIQDNREKVRQLRFDLASGKVKNIREIRKVKKIIARSLTAAKEGNKK